MENVHDSLEVRVKLDGHEIKQNVTQRTRVLLVHGHCDGTRDLEIRVVPRTAAHKGLEAVFPNRFKLGELGHRRSEVRSKDEEQGLIVEGLEAGADHVDKAPQAHVKGDNRKVRNLGGSMKNNVET